MTNKRSSRKAPVKAVIRSHPKMGRTLRDYMHPSQSSKAKQNIPVKVIIEFAQKPSSSLLKSLRSSVSLHPHHCRFRRKLAIIRSVSAHVHPSCLHKLCSHGAVKRVHLDKKLRISLNVATPAIGSSSLQRAGVTGKGVTIGIIDTGVYPHPDLVKPVNRIAAFKDFVGTRKKPYDNNGHGTHVAGDAAGNGFSSGGKYRGPAPRARLVVAKAFDRLGSADSSDVIAAVDWIVRTKKRYGTRIVNMSFGGEPEGNCAEDPLCQAATKASKAGLIVVAAAGNEGPLAKTIDSPGINPRIITVGAANDRGSVKQSDDTIASFSSRGPVVGVGIKPDIVAPGVNIISLRAPGSYLDTTEPGDRVGTSYFRLSGTSMSTPIVSGAIAQLLQRNSGLTPGQVKALLKRNALKLRNFGPDAQGKGEIRVGKRK